MYEKTFKIIHCILYLLDPAKTGILVDASSVVRLCVVESSDLSASSARSDTLATESAREVMKYPALAHDLIT